MKKINGIGENEFNREGYLAILGMMNAMALTLKLNGHEDIVYGNQNLEGEYEMHQITLDSIIELSNYMFEMKPSYDFDDELEE